MYQYNSDIIHKHNIQFKNLFGQKVVLPNEKSYIINTFDYTSTQIETSILNKGFNFGIKRRYDPINNKFQMEKVYFDINKQRQEKVVINEECDLKLNLKLWHKTYT